MKGKVFKENANIWQDQAKVLFDYYKKCAVNIVREEEQIEKKIGDLQAEKEDLEMQISKLWYWFFTIILFFMYFIKKKQLEEQIASIDEQLDDLRREHDNIFRGYKVKKLGVAYVPVAEQVKYDNKSFMVDLTGEVDDTEVTLQVPRQHKLLVDTISKIDEAAKEAPIVETSVDAEKVETDKYSTSIQEVNEHDYIGALERSLRTITYCMGELDTSSVELPLVENDSDYLDMVDEYATSELPANAKVIDLFDKDKYADGINKFKHITELKDSLSKETLEFEDVLKSLMKTLASSVQVISALKVASVDKVVGESHKVLYNILKAPYNHYSPTLEFEEIDRIRHEKFDFSQDIDNYEPFNLKESSKVRFNPLTGQWVSEDGSVTTCPFGVHQIYQEIVAPVVQNLLEENRVERLKIYNHIKDQKISYLNKWHQDTDAFYRANRAESQDLINLMQESLRQYVAAYNTLISLKRTEDSMAQSDESLDSTVVEATENTAETLAAFEMQYAEFKKVESDFEDYIDRIKEDIDAKGEKFGHVENFDARLRDGYSNEAAVAAGEVSSLNERRRDLANVTPHLAKASELPPEPNVDDIVFEQFAINLPAMVKETIDMLEHPENYDDEEEEADVAVADAANDIDTNQADDESGAPDNEEYEEEDSDEDYDEEDDDDYDESDDDYDDSDEDNDEENS